MRPAIGNAAAMLAITMLALPALACAPADDEDGGDTAMDDVAAEADAAAEDHAMMPPDTTDMAVWAHLQGSAYQSWGLWPGTTRLYSGEEPHGMLLTTYVNETAGSALGGSLPDGSIVVKENYTPDSTLVAVTVMMKVDGYNPEHADWLFAKYQPDGGVDAFGRAAGCQACHAGAEGGDYLFNTSME